MSLSTLAILNILRRPGQHSAPSSPVAELLDQDATPRGPRAQRKQQSENDGEEEESVAGEDNHGGVEPEDASGEIVDANDDDAQAAGAGASDEFAAGDDDQADVDEEEGEGEEEVEGENIEDGMVFSKYIRLRRRINGQIAEDGLSDDDSEDDFVGGDDTETTDTEEGAASDSDAVGKRKTKGKGKVKGKGKAADVDVDGGGTAAQGQGQGKKKGGPRGGGPLSAEHRQLINDGAQEITRLIERLSLQTSATRLEIVRGLGIVAPAMPRDPNSWNISQTKWAIENPREEDGMQILYPGLTFSCS